MKTFENLKTTETPSNHMESLQPDAVSQVQKFGDSNDQVESNSFKEACAKKAAADEKMLQTVREEIAELGDKRAAEVEAEKEKIAEQLVGWQKFYKEVFNEELDITNIEIPEKPDGFDRLIVMKEGLTAQSIFEKCENFFDIRKRINDGEDSEKMSWDEIIKSDRNTKERSYAVWTPDDIEANAEHENISSEDIESGKVPSMTFEERLLLEMSYFLKTGNHLDTKMITLCSGSHFTKDSKIPCVTSFEGNHKVVIIISEFLLSRVNNGNIDVRKVAV